MLEWGIHPPMLKESIGVILPKPGKTSPKTDPASDLWELRPDASDVFSASHASCAS